ncbi:MAG: OmpA family protein [Spongiibacteraceae bacterium]
MNNNDQQRIFQPMDTLMKNWVNCIAIGLLLLTADVCRSEVPWGTDVAGAQDHPLMQRFTGAWLVGYRQQSWTQTLWPTSTNTLDSSTLKDVQTIEGKSTQLIYLAPKGKSPLEVFRNHQQAFAAAGFKTDWSCETNCERLYWAWNRHTKPTDGINWQTQGYIPAGEGTGRYNSNSALQASHGLFWAGSAVRSGAEFKVLLYVSDAANTQTGIATAYVQIIEPKAMTAGQVSVADADTLKKNIASEGKAILGGLLFDTGKATLKSESKAQLDAMAQILKAQPDWRVFIVGHTDNVGHFEANQLLAQQRAQAVVNALIAAPYNIDAKRLLAKGAANIAPIATNADESGRARNRRVEMVLQ